MKSRFLRKQRNFFDIEAVSKSHTCSISSASRVYITELISYNTDSTEEWPSGYGVRLESAWEQSLAGSSPVSSAKIRNSDFAQKMFELHPENTVYESIASSFIRVLML